MFGVLLETDHVFLHYLFFSIISPHASYEQYVKENKV